MYLQECHKSHTWADLKYYILCGRTVLEILMSICLHRSVQLSHLGWPRKGSMPGGGLYTMTPEYSAEAQG